ncbi:MAG: DUF188 domain-containing protein [Firmicutes bacterium]|nr:DUF188 domain-containing protein [Bacillota bacterium]
MKILVDADACPVKEEAISLAGEYEVEVWLVASVNHVLPAGTSARLIQVDDFPEAVDLALISRAEPGDVVVTADHGLVALAMAKSCRAVSPRGRIFRPDEVESLLASRHLAKKLRGRKGVRLKGPPPFKEKDRNQFVESLSYLLRQGKSNK